MIDIYKKCNLCPRNCLVNRFKELGYCKSSDKLKVARCALHYYEEPSISGSNGSGTIFFSNCNLKCCYCQNKEISKDGFGKEITIEQLALMMLDLQKKNANNINIVTPTHYVPSLIEAIKIAKEKGLIIPIIYNTSGYESVNTIKLLKDYVDIFLTDFKYYDNKLGVNLSKCENYFQIASKALLQMYKQVGKNKFNDKGIMEKGIIVRLLVLPKHGEDTKRLIKYLYKKYQNNIYFSIMNQYTPISFNEKYPFLNLTVTNKEYDDIIEYALYLGITNCYIQDEGTCSESFIPPFDLTGV